jgi:hypothetical protein
VNHAVSWPSRLQTLTLYITPYISTSPDPKRVLGSKKEWRDQSQNGTESI